MKIKRLVLCLSFLFVAFFLTGCNDSKKLKNALSAVEESKNSSYTALMEVETTASFGDIKNTVSMKMTMKNDHGTTYISSNINDYSVEMYMITENDTVKTYQKIDGSDEFVLKETIDLKDYSSQLPVLKAEDINDYFKYQKGVYVGNVDKFSAELVNAISSVVGEASDDDSNYKITRYDIKLKGSNVEKIWIDIEMNMDYEGTNVKSVSSVTITYSDINKTTVEKPQGLE